MLYFASLRSGIIINSNLFAYFYLREYVERPESQFFHCPNCPFKGTTQYYLTRHIKSQHSQPEVCSHCNKVFKHKLALKQHMIGFHGDIQYNCQQCLFVCTSQKRLEKHILHSHTK